MNSGTTLHEASKLARVKTLTYAKNNKGREPKNNFIAWEEGCTTVVHSYNKQALTNLLLDYAMFKQTGKTISVVEFGASRGFNIKFQKESNGPHNVAAERA